MSRADCTVKTLIRPPLIVDVLPRCWDSAVLLQSVTGNRRCLLIPQGCWQVRAFHMLSLQPIAWTSSYLRRLSYCHTYTLIAD